MKKMLSIALAALAVFSLSTTAFAAEGPELDLVERNYKGPGYTETDIGVDVAADFRGEATPYLEGTDPDKIEEKIVELTGEESEPKIYVEVEWEKLKFIYDFGTVEKYEWNLDTLEYDAVYDYMNGEGRGWIDNDAVITFHNKSNRDVYTGVSFEKNEEDGLYKNVEVSFDHDEVLLKSAVGYGIQSEEITMTVDGAPADEMASYFSDFSRRIHDTPELGYLKFYISEESRIAPPEDPTTPDDDTDDGEHVCHFVYDQFGRLVCTGCGKIKHEYCIDMDEDGLCDECGLERDFCPDCHVGGTCKCT